MIIQFETRLARQLRLDAARQQKYVKRFRRRYNDWAAGKVSLTTLCLDAGDAFDGYVDETLDVLFGGAAHRPTLWPTSQYHDGISSVGRAIRDEVTDPSARHTVAQTLQERMFRAELQLLSPRAHRRVHTAGKRPVLLPR